MIAFYAQIKLVHVIVALLSGSLFALRGGCVLAGARWPLATPIRWTSYAIDTTLLTAALMLLTLLPDGVFANGWLAVKICLIVTYVGLGTFAMKRARTLRARRWSYASALLAFVAIYSTARAHSPLGLITWWFG